MSRSDQHDERQTQPEEEQQQQEEEEEILVACRCESARAVATLLHCLRHVASSSTTTTSSGGVGDGLGGSAAVDAAAARDLFASQSHRRPSSGRPGTAGMSALQPVTVFCNPSSLTFHIYGKAKQMQASVDLQKSLFSHYQVVSAPSLRPPGHDQEGQAEQNDGDAWQGSGGEFCVNLTKVLECLHLSSTLDRTKLSFSYNSSTEVFCMELLEQDTGLLLTAAIPGMLPTEDDLGNSLALAFRSSPLHARMIVQSETLKEMIKELEIVSGATHGTVSLDADGLEMECVGHLGECVVSIPSKGPHVLSLETVQHCPASKPRSYPLQSLLASMRGLDIAQETCITVNTAGMMAIQHQVVDPTVGDGNPNFVDFILCCMEDDEDDGGDDVDDEQVMGGDRGEDADTMDDVSLRRRRTGSGRNRLGSRETDRVRSARAAARGVGRESDRDDDGESSDGEDDARSAYSSLPLFGSLVNSASASMTASSPEGGGAYTGEQDESPEARWNAHKRPRRAQRSFGSRQLGRSNESNPAPSSNRTRRKLPGQHSDDGGQADREEDHSDSTNLLDDDDDDDDGSSEPEASQPLDVTEVASPPEQSRVPRRAGRDRDEDCSSPELGYGRRQDRL